MHPYQPLHRFGATSQHAAAAISSRLTHGRTRQACACASHTTLPASRPRPHASRHLTQLQWLASAASRSLRNESMRRRPVVQYLAAPRHHHQRPCHLAKANVCQLPAREPPAHPLHRAASAEPRSLRNERIRARPRAHCTATPPPPADRPRHEPCEAAGRRHVHSHLTRAAAYATHERAMPCACQVHRTHLARRRHERRTSAALSNRLSQVAFSLSARSTTAGEASWGTPLEGLNYIKQATAPSVVQAPGNWVATA